MDEYDEAILFTFALLESRLNRLEYVVGGPPPPTAGEKKPQTLPDRIHKLEQALQQLAGKTALLDEANNLCLWPSHQFPNMTLTVLVRRHKDVLTPPDEDPDDSSPLDTAQKAVLVIERATGFATTASQLKALEDQQIATTDGFTRLAMLRPRIAEAEHRQLEQALRVSELRRRNGLVNQRYKQVTFLGAGRCWVDYNERLSAIAKRTERSIIQ